MREKLIELLESVPQPELQYGQPLIGVCKIADHLIANGVVIAENATTTKWIPVTERLPEERDSFFAKFYGTEKWADGMFLKISKEVLTCVEYTDGTIAVKALHTTDGKWRLGFHQAKVTHWMPQARAAERRMSMPKVWCAAIECENNKNNQCKAAEINLSEGHIHTVHQGFKQVWECRNYNMSKEAKELKALFDAAKGE